MNIYLRLLIASISLLFCNGSMGWLSSHGLGIQRISHAASRTPIPWWFGSSNTTIRVVFHLWHHLHGVSEPSSSLLSSSSSISFSLTILLGQEDLSHRINAIFKVRTITIYAGCRLPSTHRHVRRKLLSPCWRPDYEQHFREYTGVSSQAYLFAMCARTPGLYGLP